MLASRPAILISLFLASTTFSHAEDIPTAPPRLKDAEAQGLTRLSMTDLKAFLPGKIDAKSVKGRHVRTFNPDGTAHRTGFGQKESDGTWRFDEKNNAYCNAFKEKKGVQENCFAVFRASDGTHYFDYEVDTGFYAHTWLHVGE